ncbi:MAG: calcium/sodium antiporter [Planctomycetaceae bacterium]
MTAIFFLVVGTNLLVVGADWLVKGASRLAALAAISPLVIGLTVVAFGTSAPEMAVSISASLSGNEDLAVGNVVGSNIFNVLLILGISALIVPLTVHQKLIRFDVPLMIVVSWLSWVFADDRMISFQEGALLFFGLILFTAGSVIFGKDEPDDVVREYAAEFPSEATTPDVADTERPASGRNRGPIAVLLILVGLGLLILGSKLLVLGATEMARWWGVSELIIGLTIVAGGTSLPEVATSVVAAVRGERDIAVGNVIGSNLFNLLGVLGLAAVVASGGVPVGDQAFRFDIPLMVAVATICFPICLARGEIGRWEGALFLVLYLLYIATLIHLARNDDVPAELYVRLQWWIQIIAAATFILPLLLLGRKRTADVSS